MLSDVAGEKTYINSDATQKLGLCGKSEKIMVNVFNGKIKTFKTKTVNFIHNENVKMNVTANEANRVT